MLGLIKGEIVLCEHQIQWELNAKSTIINLKEILGDIAIDIQHIGSTSIKNIKAKPVIDIIVGVTDFNKVLSLNFKLEENGFFFRGYEGNEKQPVYQCGEFSPDTKDMNFLTHYIHIVKIDSEQWKNYVNFRDYMNCHDIDRKEYETVKLQAINKDNRNLHNYHENKKQYVIKMIEKANLWESIQRGDKISNINDVYIVNYCHPNCRPFLNIMRQPKDKAFKIAKQLAYENPQTTAFYRFADFENYYPLRLKADEMLFNEFAKLGGKPKERHPLSFVLQGSEYLDNWFENGTVVKIKLNDIPSEYISFTYGDSCANIAKTGKTKIFTKEKLLSQISGFDGTLYDFMSYIEKEHIYIEVQLWKDEFVKDYVL
jgi:GrpB-like predicted nucleotidyltransferase (UPF0157 family)